jgi:monoamine oxidase
MKALDADIIIIGAGISGLSLAKGLLDSGRKVIVVEARDRVGGRIHTLDYPFSQAVDAGAEFIHGNLPLTKALAAEARNRMFKHKGRIYKFENGSLVPADDFMEAEAIFISKLRELQEDMSLSDFMERYFNNPVYSKVKESFTRFVESFDAADAGKVSAFSVREELGSDVETAYRLNDGYEPLVKFLYRQCLSKKCRVYLSSTVNRVEWGKNAVKVTCSNGRSLSCGQLVTTVPIGVLAAEAEEKAVIHFMPPLEEKISAAKKIGYGPVIKVILEFKEVFWHSPAWKGRVKQLSRPGFLISDSAFPTWWTQHPGRPILTAWAGGRYAEQLNHQTEEEIFELAFSVLAHLFSADVQVLREQLLVYKVINWAADPYALGAYSYETVHTRQARAILNTPVEGTLFFCGEALNEGNSIGTVEAAISSAQQCLKKILES